MLADEIPPDAKDLDVRHERWLAMQSAYTDYMRTSDALECTYESADGLPVSDRVRAMILEGRHRAAFERYMEARLAFLESEFDEISQPEDGTAAPGFTQRWRLWGGEGRSGWRSLVNSRLLLETLAIILLCTTAFSLVRAQKHMRDLETARQGLETELKQTRDGLQTLSQKVNSLGSSQLPSTARAKNAPDSKPHSPHILRSSSLKSSTDRKRKPLATQHPQQAQHFLKWPAFPATEARRPKPSKSDSASARQSTRGGPRNPWWAPTANPGDSRF